MSTDPVVKFLGARAASGRSLDLLGLREEDVSPEGVIQALQARLGVVQMHAEARTPQADEVRLALHAAAATLLNVALRQAMPRERPSEMEAGEGSPAEVSGELRAASRLALEADALVAIGLAGGWNQRALDALLMSAHARGLTAEDVAEALESLEAPGRGPGGREAGGGGGGWAEGRGEACVRGSKAERFRAVGGGGCGADASSSEGARAGDGRDRGGDLRGGDQRGDHRASVDEADECGAGPACGGAGRTCAKARAGEGPGGS